MNSHIKMMLKGAIVAAGMSVAGTAVAQDEVTLRWGHYLPNSPFLEVEQNFVKNIAERTGGKVKIDITYAGGLGKGNELMTLAGRGAIDMASIVPGYYADQLLFIRAFQIPFVFDTPAEAMTLSRNSFAELPMFSAELEKFNVNFLFHQPLGVYYLTSGEPPWITCTRLVATSGMMVMAIASLRPMNVASRAMAMVGRPRPTVPLTSPPSANAKAASIRSEGSRLATMSGIGRIRYAGS